MRIFKRAALLFIVAGSCVGPAYADTVTGFGGSWTANSNTAEASNGLPSYNSTSLVLTNTSSYESGSFFYNIRQDVSGAFVVKFQYNLQSGMPDGMSFTIQNDARGPNAYGGAGYGEGYGPGDTGSGGPAITPSVAFLIDPYRGGTALVTDGNITWSTSYLAPGFSLTSQNPLDVSLAYDPLSKVLTESLNQEGTNAVYSHDFTVDIPTVVGASTAYIGFTGSTGAATGQQTISNFSFDDGNVEPSLVAPIPTSASSIAALLAAIVSYKLLKRARMLRAYP